MGAKEEINKAIEKMSEQELNVEIEECVRLLTDEEKTKFMCFLLRLAASEGLPCHLLRELRQTSVGVNS